jgi:uncharacterized protein (UPF0333 family)
MKYNKKGQAAMEFLTTYGWAFLVIILAVAGLAYFGVFDIGRVLPDGCSIEGSAFDCGDIFAISTSAPEFQMQIRNNGQRLSTVTGVEIIERSLNDGQYGSACDVAPADADFSGNGDNTINPGAQDELSLTLTSTAGCGLTENIGQKKTFDFRITYTQQGSSIAQVAEGSITTTVQ